MHQQKIFLRYLGEMLGSLALYALVLVVSIEMGRPMPTGIGRTLLMLSPMLPFCLMIWAVLRQIRRSDEYIRLQSLENIAIAAGVTAGWTFTYGFLENAGFPQISMFNVMPILGGVWGLVTIIRSLADR